MPWRGPAEPGEYPTLGYDVGEWIESHVVIPDGYRKGEPFVLTDEMWRFLLRFYQLHEDAEPWPGPFGLRHTGGQLRRSQKWGKDPLGAAVILAEALGPSRFDGFDADGEPVGAPYPTPLIVCLGTSEDQTDNTWRPSLSMIRNGPLIDSPLIREVGETKVELASGGRIEPVTTSAKARLGAPMTFVTLTEALAVDTPLPTPTGWTTMGDVQVGDRLLGSDGRPTTVVKVTHVAEDRICWQVHFADGTSVVADDGHLWLTRVAASAALPKVRTTGEMARDGRRFRVPVAAPAKLPSVALPIDPYVLGVWLGDGDARAATVSSSERDKAAMASLLSERGYEVRQVSRKQSGVLLSVVRPGARKGRWTDSSTRPLPLKTALRQQGLLENKHIPAVYLRASLEQRTDLLRGLMDTDGCVTREGVCFFAQTDPHLAQGVAELLRSLGQVVSIRFEPDVRSRRGGGYRLNFTPRGGLQPFSLPRKAELVRQATKSPEWTTVVRIEPTETVPVRCVAVDADDRLFVAGDGWHVTHNTHLFTLQGGYRKVAGAVKRNVAGMDGRWLELTNAWDPTEGSEAQVTAESGDRDVYIDTIEPRRVDDLTDDEALYRELLRQYGDSARERGGWVNIKGRIINEVRSNRHLEADRRRFFLNEIVVGESVFVHPERWDLHAHPDATLEHGTAIALGFDGSKKRDATALIASRLTDGRLFEIRVWERPDDALPDWSIPTAEVDQVLRDVFGAYDVAVMFADPYRWQDYLDRWSAEWPERIVEFPTNVEQRMDKAIERFTTAFANGELSHDAAETLTRHVKNAVLVKGSRKKPRPGEDETLTTHYLKMTKRGDGMWIDAAVAAVLAHAARAHAIENGALVMDDGEVNLW